MAYGEIPRGLSDLQVGALNASNVVSTWVDVPGPRSLSFNTESDSDELEGGNRIIAKVQNPASLNGSIELGQINFAALGVFLNAQVETSGTAGNEISQIDQKDDPGVSYYGIVGQAPGVDVAGSAYRARIMKALTTSGPDETMETNSWNTPSIDFEGLPVNGVLISRFQYEDIEDAVLPPT